ncbi:MAG: hypothetical protein FJW92_07275, partial [Actinobacteria bacterium]|nr:hypothetical protein [Actinomycetota bacterium]
SPGRIITDRHPTPEDPIVKISRLLTATLAGLAVVPAAALGHGSMSDPPSRVYQCFSTAKDHPACADAWAANPQALYDWTEVNIRDAAGRHRELIPDGKLCSAGRDKYAAFDRTVTWPATTLRPDADGTYTLTWRSTAPHATEYYRVYITKASYNPSRALGWDDLELVHDSGRGAAEATPTLRVSLPERSGRQMIYTVWQRSDSPEAFYSCSDVVMGQDGTAPGPAPQPDPAPAPAPAPANLRVTGTIASDWGGGYCRDVVVRNEGTAAVAWTVPVDVDGRITSLWNGRAGGGAITGTIRVGGEYWNAVLEGGQEATFGYCANRTSTAPAPAPAPQPDPAPAPPPDEHHDHDPAPTPAPVPAPAPAPAPAPVPAPSPGSQKVIAYFPAWGVYGRNFHVADIPAEGLTHVNYAFANIANGRCVLGDPYADIDRFYPGDSWDSGSMRGSFNQLRKLKAQHPGLRAMISVGGWTWSKGFSDVSLTDASRREFVSSCVNLYLRTDSNDDGVRDGYGDVFDGIDIDWEYPVSGGDSGMVNRPEDKRNYTLLMKEFRRQLNALEQSDGVNRRYELSIAAPAGVDKIANLEVAALVEPLDFVNVMTYDFHGAWDSTTGHNAPLVSPPGSPGDARYDQTDAIAAFLDGGAPASKVTLGLPFYGRGWTGVGTADNGRFQPATGASTGTWEAGMHDYEDLAANYVGKPGWTRLWDDVAKSPYLWNATSRTFISYDDPQSLRIKAAWARERGLGGVMIWELSSDTSGQALLNAVN